MRCRSCTVISARLYQLDPEPNLSQHFSDIHCGIRGVTREALDRINITSRGWEYASEMVLKAARLKLISSEVPIKFSRIAKED